MLNLRTFFVNKIHSLIFFHSLMKADKKNILDLLSWDGTLLILAEDPEGLLVALLRGVVVVHVGQDIAELLNAFDLVLLIHSSIGKWSNLEVKAPGVIIYLVDYVQNLHWSILFG